MPRVSEAARLQSMERAWLAVKRMPEGSTERELVERTGIQQRTLNNYLNALRDEGKIDKEGQLWFALDFEETRLRAFELTPEEAYALYLGSRLLVKQHDKRNEPAETALLKLAEVLTADAGVGKEIAQAAAQLAQRPDREGYQSVFTTLTRGYIYRKVVQITYQPLQGRAFTTEFRTYLLEPSSIGHSTYAIGYSSLPGKLRSYKLERIVEASLTRMSYPIPANFPGLEILNNAWSIFMGEETLQVSLRFSPRVKARVLETQWHPSQGQCDDVDHPGYLRWWAHVADTTDMKPWIRGWGAECEVLEPAELRVELAQEATRLFALYSGEDRGGDATGANLSSAPSTDFAADFAADPPAFMAHTANQQGQRQSLVAHLQGVAALAQEYAAAFDAGELAYALGMWHDLGKFHPDFQSYLEEGERTKSKPNRRVDHKAAGVGFALQQGLSPLMLVIQGHHGGLQNRQGLRNWFEPHTVRVGEALKLAHQHLPELLSAPKPAFPPFAKEAKSAEFFLRMLFSSLVDADFLDTEAHYSPQRTALRGSRVGMAALWECLRANQQALIDGASKTAVNSLRQEIYQACVESAEGAQGLYRLTVPTGGGKTRSGLAFALRHAAQHNLARVIVAVPFISITEQTVQEYQKIFASLVDDRPIVLEHHSGAVERVGEADEYDLAQVHTRLAAENWDAPLVVTTTVQLFESLFANKTSRCRKLHRLAKSVIVLDEVQALPVHLLEPILDALRELCAHYGTTVVLSTATQPALDVLPVFQQIQAKEITPDPVRAFRDLKRVEYEWRIETRMAWTEVAALLEDAPQALIIVNTKKDALALLDALDDGDVLHLSTLLCGKHRRLVLDEVKRRLKAGEPCRLVSTQVVEAGVDLDFPLVLRALGPLASIIQAAGRANREGKLATGRVIIFDPEEGGMPPGSYKRATQLTRSALHGGAPDLDDPATIRAYYADLLRLENTDQEKIQTYRADLNYLETAKNFRMIEGETMDVIVPYGSDEEQAITQQTIALLQAGKANLRESLRSLQPYMVSLYQHLAKGYLQQGLITEILPGLGEWHGGYDFTRGLIADGFAVGDLVI